MGKSYSPYNNNHSLLGFNILKLFGIFIYIISNLEHRDFSYRNYVLIYFFIWTNQPLSSERMQKDDGWAPLCLDLDVSSNQFCLSYTYPEQHLSQNRIIRNGNKGPSQRTCNISELYMVSQSTSPLFQVHRTIPRKTHIREVRNRTVTECCEGYVQLYSECVPKCSDCKNFQCNSTTNQCTCLPGFIGSLCNETCEDGKWGEQCSEVCICRIGEDCDKATGFCTIRPTEDSSTSPPAQSSEIDTTTPVLTTDSFHLLTSQSSLVTNESTIMSTTMSSATSLPTIPTPHTTSTVENKSTTTEPILNSTSHLTTFFVTLPPIISTHSSTPTGENNSTISLLSTTLVNSKSVINSTVSITSDIASTVQTVVTVSSVLGKEILNNLTSNVSVYNITSSSKQSVTESMPSTSEPSEITSTIKSQVAKPLPNELFSSTNGTILSSLNISQENYSKDINVSLESTREFSLNSTMMYAQWINELSANSSVTLAAALVLLVLVIVTTSVIVRCCSHKKSSQISNNQEENAPTLPSRNSHYDVPGPPTFSFINAFALELFTKDIHEANYDHPCSARCLVNEPVYDELRY